jgi:polyisoprenoid-binding protein YceI
LRFGILRFALNSVPSKESWNGAAMKARSCLPAIVLALAMLGCTVASIAATFRVAPEQTSVSFEVANLGIASQGRFDLTSGKIVLDPERRTGSVEFVVDASSIDTGWNLRDAFLKSDLMFDVERYPSIRFHSTRLAYDGERLVVVEGEITMHGVTRPVRFAVTHIECGTGSGPGRDSCDATVTGRISRSAFGMSFAIPLVGDEVALDFSVKAIRIRDAGEPESP